MRFYSHISILALIPRTFEGLAYQLIAGMVTAWRPLRMAVLTAVIGMHLKPTEPDN